VKSPKDFVKPNPAKRGGDADDFDVLGLTIRRFS